MTSIDQMTTEEIPVTGRAALSPNMRGAMWMLGACFLGAIMSAMIKWLGIYLPSFQTAFLRCLIGTAIMLPFFEIIPGKGSGQLKKK